MLLCPHSAYYSTDVNNNNNSIQIFGKKINQRHYSSLNSALGEIVIKSIYSGYANEDNFNSSKIIIIIKGSIFF